MNGWENPNQKGKVRKKRRRSLAEPDDTETDSET